MSISTLLEITYEQQQLKLQEYLGMYLRERNFFNCSIVESFLLTRMVYQEFTRLEARH